MSGSVIFGSNSRTFADLNAAVPGLATPRLPGLVLPR